MELRDYLAIVRKRWLMIAALTAATVALALGLSVLSTPLYTAQTQIYVSVQGGTTTSDMLQGANFTRQQVTSYTGLVTSPLVLRPVIEDLALDLRVDQLASRTTSGSPANSSLINISVTDESPAVAAALANAVSDEFRRVVADLETPLDSGTSTVKLTMVREATAPGSPSTPNTKLNLALGLVGGLALGLAAAVLRQVLDTKIRDEASVAQVTRSSVVGVIVFDDEAASRPLIVQSDPHSPRAEAFRRLRTNVQFLDVGEAKKTFVVTSALPGEGKSTTTINLAIALAEAGSRVVLVDADLRRPSVAKYLGMEGSAGLTTVLIGRASAEDVVQPWGNGRLSVLPSGQIPPNPSELLGSSAMTALLSELAAAYDVVLLDTPPLLPVTDAAVLAKVTNGALVVVGAGKVHKQQFAEALGSLETVGARVLGVVVNREPRKQGGSYSYYRYGDSSPEAASTGVMPTVPRTSTKRDLPAVGVESTPNRSMGGAVWPGEPFNSSAESRRAAQVPQHSRGTRR